MLSDTTSEGDNAGRLRHHGASLAEPSRPGQARRLLRALLRLVRSGLVALILMLVLARSTIPPADEVERVRAFTRPIEFDFASWTLNALSLKGAQAALNTAAYLDTSAQSQVVLDSLALIDEIRQVEEQIRRVYADPAVGDPDLASAELQQQLEALNAEQALLAPLAESALQIQLQTVLADLGLTLGGQAVPPVLYHTTRPPNALIVSPRDAIRQDANISIDPDLPTAEQVELEGRVDEALDASSLVVNIGGIGLYPTMVMPTGDVNWLSEVVAHEWTHNYLTLRPLGINYLTSPELRTINETVASIAGKEIGRALIARYYPELLPPPPPESPHEQPQPAEPAEPPAFDFRAEMRDTRLRVDALLADGKVEEAEAYMEARRQVFWEHGYRIRKINQAYFAFHGAYADLPGGAAGEDPVGAAVRALRSSSPDLVTFLRRASGITSFTELQELLAGA